jgi:hypothetical protein
MRANTSELVPSAAIAYFPHSFSLLDLYVMIITFQLPGSWRLVFGVAAFVLAFTGTVFMTIGSGSVQPWNCLPNQQVAPQEAVSEEETVEGETETINVAVDTASTSQTSPETPRTSKVTIMTTAV